MSRSVTEDSYAMHANPIVRPAVPPVSFLPAAFGGVLTQH
ncbi:hypothetical protein Pd630_LPD15029 (plasmid) [Rhodococcus opacus PD630]|nr:hypothetical protein Pd630_LPD15029 [Rhodococcus opacus PD630]